MEIDKKKYEEYVKAHHPGSCVLADSGKSLSYGWPDLHLGPVYK